MDEQEVAEATAITGIDVRAYIDLAFAHTAGQVKGDRKAGTFTPLEFACHILRSMGYSYNAIWEELMISDKQVSVHLARIRKKYRAMKKSVEMYERVARLKWAAP